jgi:eIF-2B alpha/beta/delta-like uncharacterized protein
MYKPWVSPESHAFSAREKVKHAEIIREFISHVMNRGRAENIHVVSILVEEEIDETLYWLELFIEIGILKAEEVEVILKEANDIFREDVEMCRKIGANGARFVKNGFTILTHCNAGALATAGQGTALSVLYEAKKQGKRFKVYVDESRPLLQGSRLTAWELKQAGIDTTVICDDMAGSLMQAGKIDMVIVGADRIAANGDAQTKSGHIV